MNIHNLKCYPEFFSAIRNGWKKFEIRKNDRDYQAGDLLVLQEYHPETKRYTGHLLLRSVMYLTDFEQKPGYVVLALDLPDQFYSPNNTHIKFDEPVYLKCKACAEVRE